MRLPTVRRNPAAPSKRLNDAIAFAEQTEQQAQHSFYNDPNLSDSFGNIALAMFALGRVVEASHSDLEYDYNQTVIREILEDFESRLKRLEKQAGPLKTNGRRR
jgi:hypothetical protein